MANYSKRIQRSAARAAKVTSVFKSMADDLLAEAQEQREIHALLKADSEAEQRAFQEQINALEAAHAARRSELGTLMLQAQMHGRNAEASAEKIAATFV